MSRYLMLGQYEHLELCYSYVQFEAFGTMAFQIAQEFLNQNILRTKQVTLLPLSKPMRVIELTAKGLSLIHISEPTRPY